MKMKISKKLLKVTKENGHELPYRIARDMSQIPDEQQLEVDHKDLGSAALGFLADYIDANKDTLTGIRGIQRTISMFRKIKENPDTTPISNLEILVEALIRVTSKATNRWVFMTRKQDGNSVILPYLVTGIKYVPASDREDQPSTVMKLAYISRFENHESSVTWHADELKKRTIAPMLESKGIMIATEDMVADYQQSFSRYLRFQNKWGEQFLATGPGHPADRYRYDMEPMDRDGNMGKVVNDGEVCKNCVRTTEMTLRFWDKLDDIQDEVNQRTFTVPTHPYLYMYHLDLHAAYWIHADNLELYQYDASLREKLVLPDEIRDLIDILTHDMGEIFDDIVEGKSGGTIILCRGNPGTGKTLTAEVYSEIVQKPLYKVQSGQLGLDSGSLEKKLKEVLSRAARWSAVLLIDECDVYVHERGADIRQNAVVGVFLRTLEYYTGLLFMTTNKMNASHDKVDIDDAILRRCTAIIDYRNPEGDELRRIWQVLSKAADVRLNDALIKELIEQWPDLPGGSIKSLLKLVKKWTLRYKGTPTLKTFVHMSQYAHLGGARQKQ